VRSALLAAALSCLAFVVTGCGNKIGDECKTNVDCSQEDNSRTCDISQPGGYCTVDGCDERSCPEESSCIRFFPYMYVTKPCTADANCTIDEVCIKQGQGSVCAPRASERRFCALRCGGDGDCRGGYECRQAGERGSIALLPNPTATVRFCAPRATTP
jgi:hypothetical protein